MLVMGKWFASYASHCSFPVVTLCVDHRIVKIINLFIVLNFASLNFSSLTYKISWWCNSVTVISYHPYHSLGSARAINRRYISDCVPHKLRMQASAGFVTASALGMACGPALACLFQTDFRIYRITFNEDTLPGWFMALAWLIYLLWLWLCFREPPAASTEKTSSHRVKSGLWTMKLFLGLYFVIQL